MRSVAFVLLVGGLFGCRGATADVSGTAGGVTFEHTPYVYFGGPYIVVSMEEVDCIDISFVNRSYEDGVAPTDQNVAMLQFASNADDPNIVPGRYSIDIDASFSATVVRVLDDAPTYTRASGGLLVVDEADDDWASGTFDSVAFEDGTLSGEWTAEWCRNLKD